MISALLSPRWVRPSRPLGSRLLRCASSSSSSPSSSSSSSSSPSPSPDEDRPTSIPTLFQTPIGAGYSDRLAVVPGSLILGSCVGSFYAWSIFNLPLSRELGVVVASASDWPLEAVIPVYSATALSFTFGCGVGGRLIDSLGPRAVGTLAACLWGAGWAVGSLAIGTHNLPLLYAGSGAIGGLGMALGYLTPVATLVRWFPDRRGLAGGMSVAGFGSGAILATPLIEQLFSTYSRPPTFVGTAQEVATATDADTGVLTALVDGTAQEVVVATASDAAAMALAEGVYLVGSGSTGVSETFATLGALYAAAMVTSAFTIKVPDPKWVAEITPDPTAGGSSATGGKTEKDNEEEEGEGEEEEIDGGRRSKPPAAVASPPLLELDLAAAQRTPQFWYFGGLMFANCVAGTTILSSAKTMVTETFALGMPLVVTSAFAASCVAGFSATNMLGRVGWAAASDVTGRKLMLYGFGLAGIPLCLAIPVITNSVATSVATGAPLGMVPLVAYCGSVAALVSFYGGVYAVLPAFLAETFGTKHLAGIHGRIMMAGGLASFAGPAMLASLRSLSYDSSVHELAASCDPDRFLTTFGKPLTDLDQLVQSKVVTIPRLLEILPAGTLDPTPLLYNSCLLTCAGLLSAGVIFNACIHPIQQKQA